MPRARSGRVLTVLLRSLVLCGVTLLVLAGCGAGSGDDPDAPRNLSKREYIERSNALQADAASVFSELDGPVAATPKEAAQYLEALDALHAGLVQLRAPRDWSVQHATLVNSVRVMREAMAIVSRASAKNERVITRQLQRSAAAQREFEAAVRDINATR